MTDQKPIQFRSVNLRQSESGAYTLIFEVNGGFMDHLRGSKFMTFTRNAHTGEKWINKATGRPANKAAQMLCDAAFGKSMEVIERDAARAQGEK